jgi:CRISPR-associated endonuclease/helicase Cas3
VGETIIKKTDGNNSKTLFYFGLLIRFLFSCLIDADRISTADFECGEKAVFRQKKDYVSWDELIRKLDRRLSQFKQTTPIEQIRHGISEQCLKKAKDKKGIFTLTVPTGGGKTLASLRFALHHAKEHGLDRIIYVLPYLSILDQNAKVAKDIFEGEAPENEKGRIVLEYHSNFMQESKDEESIARQEVLAQNLDAPIIFTTSVHLLNALLGGKTSDSRHFHQLANSLMIFDEIQTLPVKCAHLFCNAINFLVEIGGSSVMLCTATQPALGGIDADRGNLNLSAENELIADVGALFDDLKRVEVIDLRRPTGWEAEEIAEVACSNAVQHGSCLTIVNTKSTARRIYQALQKMPEASGCQLFHLSTNMCPKHRMEILESMREALDLQRDGKSHTPIICISTQLIEAGVDIDFAVVIRSAAGLDSIAQAAGRCNRNGLLEKGYVYIINPKDEKIDKLEDIRVGQEQANRILNDIKAGEYRQKFEGRDPDLLSPKVMEQYFDYYFYSRNEEMVYQIHDKSRRVPDDTLLNLLGENRKAKDEYARYLKNESEKLTFTQAFHTAGEKFQPIDEKMQGIIVPFEDKSSQSGEWNGKTIIAELCSVDDVRRQKELLKKAQQYSINLFESELEALRKLESHKNEIFFEVQEGVGIYALNERYYSSEFGVSREKVGEMDLLVH